MPTLIGQPTIITPAGNKPKQIEEFFGRVNSKHDHISIARMVSPAGWLEPGQRPEFQEMTVVLQGELRVEYEGGVCESHRYRSGGMDSIQHSQWCRVYCSVLASLFTRDGSPGW